MDTIKIVKEQVLRDLILKCCQNDISNKITELDISFNSMYMEVKIPKAQQPNFFARLGDIPALTKFGNMIQAYSYGNLKMVRYYVEDFSDADGVASQRVHSIDIAYNYLIEK